MRNLIITLAALIVVGGAAYLVLTGTREQNRALEFAAVAAVSVDGSVDSLQASPDGMRLLHINRARMSMDIVDITAPENATRVGRISLPGIPEGLAISPDGRWALVSLYLAAIEPGKPAPHPRMPGGLAIIDVADPASPLLTEIIGIGHQPGSVAAANSGADLVAIVAIQNAPLTVAADKLVNSDSEGTDISQPGHVQVVSFNPMRQSNYRVGSLDLSEARLSEAGLPKAHDAQPEFIALSADKSSAAATLPENNGIVVFDPYWLETHRLFATGERTPAAVAFSHDGSMVFSAGSLSSPAGDKGDLTAWTSEGEFIWSDNNLPALTFISVDRFNGTDFAFALSHTAGLIAVYDVSVPGTPQRVQDIAIDTPPGSIATVAERGLLAIAGESGALYLYRRAGTPVAEKIN